jgi:hypothetical protein
MEATPMKLVGVITTAVLSLALGAAAPVYAQQEQHEQQEEQKDKAAPQQEKHAQQEEKKAQQDKPAQREGQQAQQEKSNQREEQQAQKGKSDQKEERNEQQAQRAGGNGHGRIPDDRYRANFGREHRFRVTQGDYSNRRFQYGGYWFGFVDPWPTNWLYTQEVFVVDIDGVYYLCNPMYPGINIALSLTL